MACCAHLFSAEWWADWAAEPSVDHERLLEPGPEGQEPSGNEMKMKAFEVGRVLGTGAFSTVRLVTHRASGRTYALKLVDKEFQIKSIKLAPPPAKVQLEAFVRSDTYYENSNDQ